MCLATTHHGTRTPCAYYGTQAYAGAPGRPYAKPTAEGKEVKWALLTKYINY